MSRRTFRGLTTLALSAGLLAVGGPLEAQNQPGAPPPGVVGLDPNSLTGRESTEGVYVRDSALALEKFALAQRMERLKEWNKSADLFQEVLDKYPDRVVPSRTGEGDKIVQYTSVTRGVMEHLARWPREGLEVYRARYEPVAQGLLDAAAGSGSGPGDLVEMHKVFYRYFVTEAAKSAGLRLIDVNLERGEFQAAARLADELLNWHPTLEGDRPTVLYRAGLAHRLAGDDAKAKERLAALTKDHADAIGAVRGKEVRLAESLAEELKGITALAAAATQAADSWTTLGGDASRGRVAASGGLPGARLFAVAMARPEVGRAVNNRQAREQVEAGLAADADAGMTLGVFPVVDRGELFFQDGARVYARSIESGVALPGWAQTYPGDRDGQYVLPNVVGLPRTHQLSLTLTDRAVIGVMGQPDRSLINAGVVQAAEPRLVCLDRATGRENWVVALSGLPLPKDLPEDQQKAIRTLQMNGAPLVVGDTVIVAARGVKQAQFEDCWVLCFDLSSGDYRWSCYVASASMTGAPWGMQVQSIENTAQLAYANGRVYCLTNLGALAALDAYAGTIVWLDIYERGVGAFPDANPFANNGIGRDRMEQFAPVKPWAYNPVIVKDGFVFAMPTEGSHLYVYDANNGAEVKRIRRDAHVKLLENKLDEEADETDMLLAVIGDQLVMASPNHLFLVNWRKHDPKDPAASMDWHSGSVPGAMWGRPFVTTSRIFVPAEERLLVYDMRTGKASDTYPNKYTPGWEEGEEGPGNVLVTADHVIVAGAGNVYGFTDLAVARARLDKAVAAAPEDTGPRLAYAEIMFAAGDPATAGAKLDEAAKLLGGPAAMRTGAARDRIFNLCLTFAQKLASTDVRPEARKHAEAMYDRAAAAAAMPLQQVHYRLSRARHAERLKDAPTAARLYQEILADAKLRPVPLLDQTSGGPTQAAAVAEGAIRDLVAKAGAAVYAPYEQAAAKELEAAGAAAPAAPERLLAVAQSYPNSTVAPKALLAAADAYEAAGNPRPAVQVLRQIYFKYPQSPGRARVIESMARNYLALPNRVDVAAARLAQGAALGAEQRLAKPLKLPDGRQLEAGATFAQALAEVRKYNSEAASKNLPDFGLPVPPYYDMTKPDDVARRDADRKRDVAAAKQNPRWPLRPAGEEQVIDGVGALALPLRDFARPDRVVAWSPAAGDAPATLSIYKPGDAQPLGTSDALAQPPVGSAWVGEGVLVWGATTVALLPEAGGKAVWRMELNDLPAVEVVRASELPGGGEANVVGQVRGRAGLPPGLDGRIVRNRQFPVMQDGLVLRQQAPAAAQQPARADPAAAEHVTEVKPVGDRLLVTTTHGRIVSAELAGGAVAWQTRLTDRAFDRLVATEDFTVAKVADDTAVRLIALDTVTGQIRGSEAFALVQGQLPCNMALSADGTLVYTMPDRLVLRDLYKPWGEDVRVVTGPTPAQPPYLNATGPDQLVIAEGRILALAEMGNNNSGMNKKYVRVHSLETGQPLTLRVPKGEQMVDVQLVAETDSWDVSLRVIGPRLYIVNPQTVLCYNLDRPEEFWGGGAEPDPENYPHVREVLFGQNHVVVVSRPGLPQPRKGEHQLLSFGRYSGQPGDTFESGRLDYDPIIRHAEPLTHWQGVTGGFYYLTGDGKLHFLAPAKPEK